MIVNRSSSAAAPSTHPARKAAGHFQDLPAVGRIFRWASLISLFLAI